MSEGMFAAPTTEPESLLRVTAHELATLFHVATPPGAQRTREALRLPELTAGDAALTASLSSLVLRGLARDEAGRLVPTGNLAVLCSVLFTATRWVEAVGTARPWRQGALVVVAPEGSAILEWQPSGIWQALPVERGTDPVETAAGYVAASFARTSDRPFGGAVTVTDDEGARTAGVRVDEDGAWTLAAGPADDVSSPRPVEADDRFRMLVEALS